MSKILKNNLQRSWWSGLKITKAAGKNLEETKMGIESEKQHNRNGVQEMLPAYRTKGDDHGVLISLYNTKCLKCSYLF